MWAVSPKPSVSVLSPREAQLSKRGELNNATSGEASGESRGSDYVSLCLDLMAHPPLVYGLAHSPGSSASEAMASLIRRETLPQQYRVILSRHPLRDEGTIKALVETAATVNEIERLRDDISLPKAAKERIDAAVAARIVERLGTPEFSDFYAVCRLMESNSHRTPKMTNDILRTYQSQNGIIIIHVLGVLLRDRSKTNFGTWAILKKHVPFKKFGAQIAPALGELLEKSSSSENASGLLLLLHGDALNDENRSHFQEIVQAKFARADSGLREALRSDPNRSVLSNNMLLATSNKVAEMLAILSDTEKTDAMSREIFSHRIRGEAPSLSRKRQGNGEALGI